MELPLNSPPLSDNAELIEKDYPLHPAPVTNLSDEAVIQADMRREQVREARPDGSFVKAVKEQDFIFPALDDLINSHNFPFDPTWDGPTDEMLAESQIPRDLMPELYKTVNEDHYWEKVGKIHKALANEEILADYGVKGAFARLGLNLLDPGNLAIAATVPLLGAGVPQSLTLMKLGRLGSAIRGSAIAGAESAGVQALINQSNPLGDGEDIMYAGLFGIGLGGVVGGTFYRGIDKEIHDKSMELVGALESNYRQPASVSTTGAMEVTGPAANQSLADKPLTPEEINAPRTAFEYMRYDTAAQVSRSGLDSARKIGIDWVEDSVGKQGHAVNSAGGTASTIQRQTMKAWTIGFRHAVEPVFLEYSKSLPKRDRWLHPVKIREDFFKNVFRQIELEDSTDPNVIKAADRLRDVYGRMLDEQQSAKVFGSANIPKDRRYVPHIWVPQKVRQMIDDTNVNTVTRLFYDAMTRGIDVDEDEARSIQRVATAVVKKLDGRASSVDELNGFHLNLTDAEQLKILLREIGEETDDDALETIVRTVTKKQKDVGKAGHLRRRMDLDMAATVRHPRTGKEISLYDLMETDAEKATLRYIQKAAGLVGFARKGYGVERSVTADIGQALKRIEDEARSKGISQDVADKSIHALRVASDNILGKPMDDLQRTAFGRALRASTDAAFIRYMGQTGAASIAELGQAIGYAGIIPAVRQLLPSVHKVFDSMTKGTPEAKTLATEWEAVGAWGGHRLNNKVSSRYNDHDVEFMSNAFKRFDAGLQIGKQLTVKYSGLGIVTDFSQEFALRAISQRMFNQATDSATDFEKVWGKTWKRMHLYGIEKPMAERIFQQIRKHSTSTKSKLFKTEKLGRFNLTDWDDKQALDAFTNGMFRMVTHAVQETDPGNMAPWMHKDLAKAFMQFRSFIAGSYTRATLNGIHMRDAQAGIGFIASMSLGWMAYVAQNYINSVGQDDDYLELRMSPERQLAAFYSRSAFASFTPVVIDGMLELGGEDPLFNFTRSSGQTQLTLPAWEMLNSAKSLVDITASAVTPREVTEGDMDSAMGLISNMWIIRNITGAIDDAVDLPREQDN